MASAKYSKCIEKWQFYKSIFFIQLRLDFTTFVITGPQTSSQSAFKTKTGELTAANTGLIQSLASQCLTDTFSVSSGGITPPVICGTNSGEHSKRNFLVPYIIK